MKRKAKEGVLLLVQTDSVTGEALGIVIDCLYEAGAKNVQVISSVTKKTAQDMSC